MPTNGVRIIVMANHNDTGKKGEVLARAYFEGRGYEILEVNWRYSYYEIDIIAVFDFVLHFIEVKTRRTVQYGFPEESVDRKKMERLMAAADEYLYQNPHWKRVQYDVLSILIRQTGTPDYYLIEDVSL